jgi:NADH:ubiquinone oxidoreductase subunit 5 (subunit L)/multisubunit Na+/H+ antiporter MnhA subunit
MGWELLGLSSVLLIGFYEHRIEPIKNAIRILFIYKVADIFLFMAFLVAMLCHVESLSQLHLIQEPGVQVFIYSFIFIACLIKSGIFPWQWLPRAMEGPTPSSSIFYGALATHIPLMMLIQIWPASLYAPHPLACAGIVICFISALFSNGLAKQTADAKGSLAYAITTQLALIYIELLLGFKILAMIHALSHGLFRTFDLLKTPSIIHTLLSIELNRKHSRPQHKKTSTALNKFLYALTLKKYGLQKLLFSFIDYFLGLKTQERSQKHFIRFSLISLIVGGIISILSLNILHESLYIVRDELIVMTALGCTFAAFHNLKKTAWFLLLICASMALLYLSLLGQIFEKIATFEWLILIIAGISLIIGFQKHKDSSHMHYSKREGLLILILGLCIVGIPGLAGHFLWENIVHVVAFISPHLVLSSFFVMSLNTVLFIMFYYQYLMRPRV